MADNDNTPKLTKKQLEEWIIGFYSERFGEKRFDYETGIISKNFARHVMKFLTENNLLNECLK